MDQTEFESAKQRLNQAAMRLLAGDRSAAAEADEAMKQVERLMDETKSNDVVKD